MSTNSEPVEKEKSNQTMKLLLDAATLQLSAAQPADDSDPIRRSGPVETGGAQTIALVEDEFGILRWRISDLFTKSKMLGGRRSSFVPNLEGEAIWEKEIQTLGKNNVIGLLQSLDMCLNRNQGLRMLKGGALEKADEQAVAQIKGRILVLVHGTFSNTEALLKEFNDTPEGRDYLSFAESNYTKMFAFDHSTVSINPFLNALAVSALLNQTTAELDVICHSRGGLVTKWWLEILDREDRKRRRAVVVGSTLRGTSLAAPDRVRKGFDHLSNMVRAIGALASAVPFAAGITGLMSVAASCAGAAAHTPAIDALFAMVPGLAAMSRIANNNELNQLQRLRGNAVEYYGVKSNFEPPEFKIWQFWKAFNGRPMDRITNALADDFIFRDKDGDEVQNDLVVDCDAMAGLPPFEVKEWCDFRTSSVVHHTNYFSQRETVNFIRTKLS
jgi:hypothetical protein